MAEVNRLLNKTEVAQLVRVTPRSLDKYRAAGAGPAATRIGGRILFRSEDVAAWIQRRSEVPHAA